MRRYKSKVGYDPNCKRGFENLKSAFKIRTIKNVKTMEETDLIKALKKMAGEDDTVDTGMCIVDYDYIASYVIETR